MNPRFDLFIIIRTGKAAFREIFDYCERYHHLIRRHKLLAQWEAKTALRCYQAALEDTVGH